MNQQSLDNQQQSILTQVYEGMDVFDADGDKVGTVRHVFLGQDQVSVGDYQVTAPTDPNVDPGTDNTLINMVADVFDPNDIPEELRERLLRSGYVRIDTTGIFNADSYVTSEHIAGVSKDNVRLNIDKDQVARF